MSDRAAAEDDLAARLPEYARPAIANLDDTDFAWLAANVQAERDRREQRVAAFDREAFVRDLLETHTNNWGGGDDLATILESRYAVVIERSDDAWVVGADTGADVAGIALGCCVGPEYEIEWIAGVYDVATGAPVACKIETTVVVTINGEDFSATTARPAQAGE